VVEITMTVPKAIDAIGAVAKNALPGKLLPARDREPTPRRRTCVDAGAELS